MFKWSIIALQHRVGFCHTSPWISHRYTYVPPSWTSLPPSTPSHPSRLSPAEPPGKPKNAGVGSPSLSQQIFPTWELNQVSCIAGGFFTSWATREAHSGCHRAPNLSSLHHKANFHCMLDSLRWAFSPLMLFLESFCVRSCLILLSNKTFSLSGLTVATCACVCVCLLRESGGT